MPTKQKMAQQLIITNGDDIVGRCRKAEIGDDHLAWLDVLFEGPIPADIDLAPLSARRANWIAAQGFALSRLAHQRFVERDNRLETTADDARIVLLFEHDLLDQLQLLQLLDWFAARPQLAGRLHLAQSRQYFAALTDGQLTRLCEAAPLVKPEQLTDAQRAWQAVRSATPERLLECVDGCPALPHVGAALRRLLEELPAVGSGLGRSEWQVLVALGGRSLAPPDIFDMVSQMETAIFMGDWSLYAVIDRLAFWPNRLIHGHTGITFNPNMALQSWRRYNVNKLQLSRLGEEVLAGATDAATLNRIDRWVGGTHLVAGRLWRIDRASGQLKVPA